MLNIDQWSLYKSISFILQLLDQSLSLYLSFFSLLIKSFLSNFFHLLIYQRSISFFFDCSKYRQNYKKDKAVKYHTRNGQWFRHHRTYRSNETIHISQLYQCQKNNKIMIKLLTNKKQFLTNNIFIIINFSSFNTIVVFFRQDQFWIQLYKFDSELMKPNNSHDNLGRGIYSQKKPIEISFRTLMGKGDKIVLEPNCTIEQLTQSIGKILKEQPSNIQLYSLGRYLKKKESTLQQYGLKDGSIVHIQYFYEHFKKTRVSLPQEHKGYYNVFQRYSQNNRQVAIFLKIKGQNFEIPISNQQSVRSLKQQIQKRSNFKADYLSLQHLGKQMIDENSLQQSGIHSSAWISAQYLQPPPKHQNKFHSFFAPKEEPKMTITTQMFENIEQLQFDDRQQGQEQYHFTKNNQPIDNNTDINKMINNIKLSQSIQISSPLADVQIPYQYNYQDSLGSNFMKKSGFVAHQGQTFQPVKMEKSSPNQLRIQDALKKQPVQKFEGSCQVRLKNTKDTISYTIDCPKSSFRTGQVRKLIEKTQQSRKQYNKITLLNPNNLKPYNKDVQICELPWQSIILNNVLYVNFVFTNQKQQGQKTE